MFVVTLRHDCSDGVAFSMALSLDPSLARTIEGREFRAVDQTNDSTTGGNATDAPPGRFFRGWLADVLRRLRLVPRRHWGVVVLLIASGMLVEHWLHAHDAWQVGRFLSYRALMSLSRTGGPEPKHSVLVLIQDESYWDEPLAGRVPIRRDYLARLVRRLAEAEPQVIAIDFDLRGTASPEAAVEYAAYAAERAELLEVIREVAKDRCVVLPGTTRRTRSGEYHPDRAIYDHEARYDAPGILPVGELDRVRIGYIEGIEDIRTVPLSLPLHGGTHMPSFSLAIVGCFRPDLARRISDRHQGGFPYASYITPKRFKPVTLSSRQVLEKHGWRPLVQSRIVIVGAGWHSVGLSRGFLIDTHETPVGPLGGPFIHANYVEAMLDDRTFSPFPAEVLNVVEVVLVVFVAMALAIASKVGWKVLLVLGAGVGFFALNVVLVHNFGIYCDFLIPLVLIGSHPIVEHLLEVW